MDSFYPKINDMLFFLYIRFSFSYLILYDCGLSKSFIEYKFYKM